MAPLWIGASPNSCGGATTPQDRALHGRFAWCDLGLNRRSGGRRRGGDRIRGVHGLCKSPAATPENRDATIHANVLCFMQTRTKLCGTSFIYMRPSSYTHTESTKPRGGSLAASRAQSRSLAVPSHGRLTEIRHNARALYILRVHVQTSTVRVTEPCDGVLCVSTHAYACPGRSRRSFLQTTELSILFCR